MRATNNGVVRSSSSTWSSRESLQGCLPACDVTYQGFCLFSSLNAISRTTVLVGSGVTLVNCTTHGINAVFVLVDMMISRTPIRMLHLFHCTCMGSVYLLFSYVYHLAGGTNHKGEPYIYKPLDYANNFRMAISTGLVCLLLVLPLIHCWIFFLYRFRLFIHRYLKAIERRVDNQPEKVL